MASAKRIETPSSEDQGGFDIKTLLQDFSLLKAEVTVLKTKLEVSERVVAELKTELAALRNSGKPVTSISPRSAHNVCVRRGARNANTSPVSIFTNACATGNSVAQVNERPAPMTSIAAACAPTPVPAASSSATRVPKQKSYAQVSRPPPGVKCVVAPKKPVNAAKRVDVDGFTLVEKKRRPKPSRNRRGTADATASEVTLRVVEPTVSLYISRLDPNTTGEEVLGYVKQRVCFWTKEPIRLNLRRLESTRGTSFKSYVLQVPAKYKDMFLNPDFWPTGVVYRRYREAIQKKTP